jgi:hypothetical protein
MSGYGFGKKPAGETGMDPQTPEPDEQRLDFSGIRRAPVAVDIAREEAAIQRGDALGFVDRGAASEEGARRRRRSTQPQINVFIKGPKDTLEWFIEYTNQRGHRSYWQTLEEFRAMVEGSTE